MPANSTWDLIQRLSVKIVKNPGNGRLNNLNDPVLNVLKYFEEGHWNDLLVVNTHMNIFVGHTVVCPRKVTQSVHKH